MAQTPSNMLPIGTKAPNFTLKDVISNEYLSLSELKGSKATVFFFICNHCPFVIHINKELVSIANDFSLKGVSFIAISSNDVVNYPQDAPPLMKEIATLEKYPFPYLYDENQEVAKVYHAACTPDIYVFDAKLKLAYRGQLDNSRPGNNIPITGKDLRNALANLLDGIEISGNQKPSIGCNIKWKV